MLETNVVESAVVVIVLEYAVVLDVLDALEEPRLVVAAAVGAPVSIMMVARSNVCVFGSALAFPLHML